MPMKAGNMSEDANQSAEHARLPLPAGAGAIASSACPDAMSPSSQHRAPMRRSSSLMPKYLELIRSGQKTVEGRIRAGHWADAIPGDIFVLCSNEDSSVAVEVEVASVQCYCSFQGMLEGEGVSACLPGVASVGEGVAIYRAIPGYRERETPNGVVALRVKLLPPSQADGAR